jgi:porin
MFMRIALLMLFVLFASAAAVRAADPNSSFDQCLKRLCQRETLTNGFFGLNEALENNGFELALTLTTVYQQDARGGLSTHNQANRYSGRYDFELDADLEKLIGLKGGSVYMLTEGGWSEGINEDSVGSVFNTNAVAFGDKSIDIVQLWYQQFLGQGETFAILIGKIDLTGAVECLGCPASFDGNRYANDETMQFLNGAFVNNPSIPFPNQGLGIMLLYNPIEPWYASFGVADSQADRGSTGFNTTFDGEDNYISIFETGILPKFDSGNGPLDGAYRFGVWYDRLPKEILEDENARREDTGFYLSFDQMLMNENKDANDSQGLGAFARYGYSNHASTDVKQFISGGVQYRGLFEGRDDDVIAAAIGYGILPDNGEFTKDSETVYEAYYNAQITKWLHLTPDIQYIHHPAEADATDALVIGARVLMFF